MKRILLILLCCSACDCSFAQQVKDTTSPKELQEVMIKAWMRRDIDRLPDEENVLNTCITFPAL